MALTEIKDEIRQMSARERAEITRALLECEGSISPEEAADYSNAMDHAFGKHRELLRRLAE